MTPVIYAVVWIMAHTCVAQGVEMTTFEVYAQKQDAVAASSKDDQCSDKVYEAALTEVKAEPAAQEEGEKN